MAEYIVTSRAESDLAEILVYISNDDAGAAFAFERRLYDTFDLLAENPHDGRERPEFSEGTRSFVCGSYTILYRLWAGTVAIVRVAHGARDITALLENNE